MRVIVVGCGKIGRTIIEVFVSEGHSVVAVDDDKSVVEELNNVFDIMCVHGNGADSDTLKNAGVDHSDIVIAVTDSDETNMLTCFFAKKLGTKHTVARIRNPEYNDDSIGFIKSNLNISLCINPDMLTAHEIFNILRFPGAVKIEKFSARNLEMIEIILKDDYPIVDVKLSELRKKIDSKVLICAVQRENEVYIPDGNFELKAGDRIGVTATSVEMDKFLRELGLKQKKRKNTMILGGSRVAYYLIHRLIESKGNVTLIELNKDICTEFAQEFPNAYIINGDGTQQELLKEEGISDMDAFVTLTGLDEENIIIASFASTQNVPRIITKINRPELASIAEHLGVNTIVSPREITANQILAYARALSSSEGSSVETLYKLMNDEIEALEFVVTDTSAVTGIPLRDLKLKKNIIIAAITRNRTAIIPSGDNTIELNDRVIIISASQKQLNDITDILG